ncbi:MAG: hypothetical protein A2V84_03210 [Chloroflexi bacterium RBG_16_70_13]|nr:MAG: hypothetical protein A2V84_03210 [Chloroflexi bacterium RBG_16_70_13]
MRFAELTIFVTATGALVAATFSHVAAPVGGEAVLVLKLAGVIVTLVFWVLQQRTMLYSRHYVARAAELEAELGFRQYSTRPPKAGGGPSHGPGPLRPDAGVLGHVDRLAPRPG